MALQLTLHAGNTDATGVTVTVDAAPQTPLHHIAARFRTAVNAPANAPVYTESGLLNLDGTFGDGQLRHGSLVGIGRPALSPPPACGPLLAVIGGPNAGAYIPLRSGVTAIGRDKGCQLPLRDPDISRRHAILTCDGEGVWLVDAGSTNGIGLASSEADDPQAGETQLGERPVKLTEHVPFRCGSSVLWLTTKTAEPLPTHATADGTLEVLRPPRLTPPRPCVTIDYPITPHRPDPASTHWLSLALGVALPLVMGALVWLFMCGSMGAAGIGMLAFMAISPVLMATHALIDSWSRRRVKRTVTAEHEAAVQAADEQLAQARHDELNRRRADFPDPFALADAVATPTTRLWERRPTDTDWLQLRIGLGTLPAEFEVQGAEGRSTARPQQAHHPELPLVPAVIDLVQAGVLGVAGASGTRLCQWLVAQLAALHSPGQLRLALLTDTDREVWAPARWLPHVYGNHAPGDYGIATQASHSAAIVNALATTVKQRAARQRSSSIREEPHQADEPTIVLVYDRRKRLTDLSGGSMLLDDGPKQRVFTIYLGDDPRTLPEQCRSTVVLPSALQLQAKAPERATITSSSTCQLGNIIPDLVSSWWFDRLARRLGPLRERSTAPGGGQLPGNVSFARVLDATLGVKKGVTGELPVERDRLAEKIAARWRMQPASTQAAIGADSSGLVYVDISTDGPHALIAGTTGAGKSELLRTWLSSLALCNRPDELNMLLIDYKGGSAFAECAALPHVVGLVTDLDTALTTRVLNSLRAELHRREHCLAKAGAADFEQYREQIAEPLARLMVVIDEFATLCAELPDLVTGLVDLARRGRSLGVHLVLATQRPAGVVSGEIRANTALRICLRVTDAQDSSDVLGVPDAATIGADYAGRALLRQQGTLVPVQVARVSQPWPEPATEQQRGNAVEVRPTPWGHPPPGLPEARSATSSAGHGPAPTVLTHLVAAVNLAARSGGLAITPPISPWLPPLLETVQLRELHARGGDSCSGGAAVGLHDLPHEQAQRPYRIDLSAAGHTALVGGPHSGRTSALRAISAGLALKYSPRQLRLFVFDNDGELTGLSGLPHCDAVVAAGDAEHCQRLLRRLRDELDRRRAGRSLSVTPKAAMPPGTMPTQAVPPEPWLVVLLDSWETLRYNFDDIRHGVLVAELIALLRDGGGVGLRAFVTGGRQLLASQPAGVFSQRFTLRMTEADSYGLAGIAAQDVPSQMPPGRALLPDTPVTHMQFALLDADPAPHAQRLALAELAKTLTSAAPHAIAGALPVAALPVVVTPAELRASTQPWLLPLGLGGDQLETVALDLRHTRTAVIAGHPGSGKSTALRAVGCAALGQHTMVIVASTATGGNGCELLGAAMAHGADQLRKLTCELVEPALILVDDVELLADSDPELDQTLSELIGVGEHRVVVAGGTDELLSLYRGCVIAARRARTGLLLAARPGDGELFGQPRLAEGDVLSGTGRALLCQRGTTTPLQVAKHD